MTLPQFPARIRALEPVSIRFDAFRLAATGCDVLFASYPAGTAIEPHRHDTENWGVVTRGELLLAVGGVERRYRTGDWYHVPAGVEHAARVECDTEGIEFWFATGERGPTAITTERSPS